MSAKYRRRASAAGLLLVAALLAWVAVADTLRVRIRRDNTGAVVLDWNSATGGLYEIYWSSNLAGGTGIWQYLGQTIASGPTSTVTDFGAIDRTFPGNDPSRFYRVRTATPMPITSDITNNTSWGLSNSPYIITSDIHVHAGVSLSIGPGTRILFTGSGKLTVDGCLQALGGTGQPVTFTSGKAVPQRGDWVGLAFTASSSNCLCVLSNVVVEYAQVGINCTDTSPQIFNSTVHYSSGQGIYLTRSSPLIQGCAIQQNNSYGIYCNDTCAPQILSNQIVLNAGYGVAITGTSVSGHNSLALLRGNTLDRNSGYAVYAAGFFQPGQVVLDARSNWWGTADATLIASMVYDYADNQNSSPVVNFGNWLVSERGAAVPGKFVSGQILGDVTWQTSDSPIGVIGPLLVTSNATLTIQLGVEVDFYGNYALQVDGGFQSLGTAANPVILTSSEEFAAPGDWQGINFTAFSSNHLCALSNTVVEFAQVGARITGASPQLVNSAFQYCSQQGIYLTQSSALIQGCIIQQNNSYGIYAYDASSPQILQNQILNNGSYGVYLNGTSLSGHNCLAVVRGNTFLGNTSYALEAYYYYQANQVVIDARSNWWGTTDAGTIASMIYDYSDNTTWSPIVNFGNWLGSQGGTAVGGSAVSGQILSNTVWQASDSPVAVVGPLLVTSNATLTIQPGVQVLFYGNYSLQVDGCLRALGSTNQPVVFSSGKSVPQRGDWQGIIFTAASTNNACVISNAVVQYAQVGINCTASSPQIVGSTIQFSSQQGIYLTGSAPLIQGCIIQQNSSYGVYVYDTSSPRILQNQVLNNGNVGVYLNGTSVNGHNCLAVVQGNTFLGNISYALEAYYYYQANQVVIDARSNWWGTADPGVIAGMVYDYSDNTTWSPIVNFGNWLGSQSGTVVGGSAVSGQILSNTVWQASDSPVAVVGPLLVTSNATLTVQPGVQVLFYGNYSLQVDGCLRVLGSSNQPVTFSSGKSVPQRGDWQGLVFTAGSSNNACVISNAIVQYAQSGVNCTASSPQIVKSTIQFCSQQGIYLTGSSPLILGCTIQQNNSYGIYAYDSSSPRILQNQILNNGSLGVYLYGTSASGHNCLAVVQGNTFLGNTSYALEAYYYYQANQVVIDARSNWWGTTDAGAIASMIYDYSDNTTWSPIVNFGSWLGSQGGAAVGGSAVSGQILSNTVWQASDSPVSVVGPLLVTSNATLTIQPGVQVLFYGNYSLQVDGCLRVLGSSNQPVTFSSGKSVPQRGDWQGIVFTAGSSNNACVISNAVVQYAQVGINCTAASPRVIGATIQFSSQQGVYLTLSSPLIQSCTIQQNGSYGIYVYDASSPQILQNQIVNNGSFGVYLSGTSVSGHNCLAVVRGNTFLGNTSYALYSYSYYQPNQVIIDARSNWWGTADAGAIASLVYDYSDSPTVSPVVNFGNWLGSQGGAAVGGSSVSGQILSNTVWQASDSPVSVVGALLVASNATLTIQQGVQVVFYGNYSLQVDGCLRALGSSNQPVVFSSGKLAPQRGDWQGLVFTAGSSNNPCVISNAIVQYAQIGINCTASSPQIFSTTIQFCSQQGINLTRSSPLIKGCTIQHNSSYGIYAYDSSSPQVLGSQIVANNSYGVSLNGTGISGHNCLALLQGNVFDRNQSYAVYAAGYYQPGAVVIDARSNWWGTADAPAIASMVYDYTDNPNGSPFVNYGNWLGTQGGQAVPGRFVNGQLIGNIVWQTTDSPIGVLGPVLVTSNATLTIQPGVEVLFFGNYSLQVDGGLQALGTAFQPIVFTSAEEFGLAGDWQGLAFTAPSSNSVCVLSNTIVEYAQVGIRATDTSFQLANSTVQFCSQQGIYLTRSSPAILGCAVTQNNSYGIYCLDASSPRIIGSQIINNASYGILLNGTGASGHNCLPIIQGNTLLANGSYAIVAQSYFQAGLVTVDVRSNWWGTADANVIVGLVYDYADDPNNSPVVNFANWLGSASGPAAPGRCVAGRMVGNIVWQTSDSPIGLIGPLLVSSNAVLTIQPGAQMLAYGNFQVQVDGTLQALGQPDNPILFTSGKPVPSRGDWQGLAFNAGSSNNLCVISNAVVQYAQVGINCTATSPQILGSTIQFCSQQGISLTRSSPLIQGCLIQQNSSYGIYVYDASSPVILGSQILTNGNNGVYLSGTGVSGHNSLPILSGNTFLGNGSYGVAANGYYQPNLTVIDARSNWWGTVDATVIAVQVYDYTDNPNGSPVVNFGNWFASPAGPAVPGHFVSGQIAGSVTWQTIDSPIGIIGPVQVLSNASLTIQPGVQVLVYGNYSLQVDGGFQALGQPAARVVFSSGRLVPQKSDWVGLKFSAGSTNNSCQLSNVVVEFADIAVNAVQSSPSLSNSQLRQNRIGVYLDTASSLLASNLVEFNDTGISCYQFASPLLVGNTIVLNRFNGVELISSTTSQDRNPRPVLTGNSIFTNATAGPSYYNLYAYSFYQPAATTISAVSNWWGTTDSNLVRQTIYYYSNNPSSSPLISFAPFLGSNINFTPYGATNSSVWFSPNADNSGDTVSVVASLTSLSTWSVAFVDMTGVTARTLTGSGPSVSSVWNGTNQLGNPAPEGRYRVVITATNLSDGRVSVEYGGVSVLDRTFPVANGAANTLSDGTVANQLVLRGTVSDSSFYGYALDYGTGLNPSTFTLLISNSVPISAGILGQLDSRSLSNGLYTFRLRVYDYAGNITTNLIMVTIDNVLIINPDAPTVFFDPVQGPDSITFNLNKASDVLLTLSPVAVTADGAGNMTITPSSTPVRTFSQHLAAGAASIPWDGRDNLGSTVPNAAYVFRIFVQSDLGRSNSYDPPYVSGPVTFTTNGFSTNINFQGNDPVAISYNLYAPAFVGLGLASPVSGNILAGVARDAGPNTEYWNGRLPATHQVINGAFQVNLLTRVMPENSVVVNHQPVVSIGSLKTESYVVTPSHSEVSVIYYSLQRQADVTLWMRDPNGNRLSLLQQSAQLAGSYNFEWNGYFDAGSIAAIAGDYEVHLDTTDTVTGDNQSVIGNLTVRR